MTRPDTSTNTTTPNISRTYTLSRSQAAEGEGPVFIGLDVHKKNMNFCIVDDSGEVIDRGNRTTDLAQIEALVKKYNKAGRFVYVAFEAGPTGYRWSPVLNEMEFCSTLVAATIHIRRSQSDRRHKTDKRDAEILAKELWRDELVSIAELSIAQQEDRQLLRTVKQLTEARRKAIQQIKSTVLFHGIVAPWEQEDHTVTGLRIKDLKWLRDSPTGTFGLDLALKIQADLLIFLSDTIRDAWKELGTMMKTEAYDERYQRLVAIPGVAQKSATHWLLETPDPKLFHSAEAFTAWLGLVPSERSSGGPDKIRRGRTTRAGNSRLRTILIEIAPVMARHDPALKAKFDKLRANTGHYSKARVALARVVATRIFAMMRSGSDWIPGEAPEVPEGTEGTEALENATDSGDDCIAPGDGGADAAQPSPEQATPSSRVLGAALGPDGPGPQPSTRLSAPSAATM